MQNEHDVITIKKIKNGWIGNCEYMRYNNGMGCEVTAQNDSFFAKDPHEILNYFLED